MSDQNAAAVGGVKANTLEGVNIRILVDKSASMNTADMPNGKTRWEYAAEYAKGVVKEVSEFDDDGMEVAWFNNSVDSTDGVTGDTFGEEWDLRSPRGGTVLAPGLKWGLDLHFAQKAAGEKRPTLFIVITDGEPQDAKSDSARVIIDAANRIDKDSELAILFLQIGNDPDATAFLTSLDDDLQAGGATYDIVDRKSIEDVAVLTTDQLVEAAFND